MAAPNVLNAGPYELQLRVMRFLPSADLWRGVLTVDKHRKNLAAAELRRRHPTNFDDCYQYAIRTERWPSDQMTAADVAAANQLRVVEALTYDDFREFEEPQDILLKVPLKHETAPRMIVIAKEQEYREYESQRVARLELLTERFLNFRESDLKRVPNNNEAPLKKGDIVQLNTTAEGYDNRGFNRNYADLNERDQKAKYRVVHVTMDRVQVAESVPDGAFKLERFDEKNIMHVPTIKHVSFPEGLKTIGRKAFSDNTFLQCELFLPDSLERIMPGAFAGTRITGHLQLPPSLVYVGSSAFYRTQISSLTLPENACAGLIEEHAFRKNINLKKITVPASADIRCLPQVVHDDQKMFENAEMVVCTKNFYEAHKRHFQEGARHVELAPAARPFDFGTYSGGY
jgi:hypothetical protein